MDTAVASLVLCSVPDQARALTELHRVLGPGGELRFFEHVRADTLGLARLQRLADLLWPRLMGGCHTSRDILAAITTAGSQITSLQRFRFPDSRLPQPAAPHVLGVAHRPTSPRRAEALGPSPQIAQGARRLYRLDPDGVTALRAYRGRIPPLTGTITVDASIDQTFHSFTDSFASWWPFLTLIERSPKHHPGYAHDLKDWLPFLRSPTWASTDSVGSRPAQVVARR